MCPTMVHLVANLFSHPVENKTILILVHLSHTEHSKSNNNQKADGNCVHSLRHGLNRDVRRLRRYVFRGTPSRCRRSSMCCRHPHGKLTLLELWSAATARVLH